VLFINISILLFYCTYPFWPFLQQKKQVFRVKRLGKIKNNSEIVLLKRLLKEEKIEKTFRQTNPVG